MTTEQILDALLTNEQVEMAAAKLRTTEGSDLSIIAYLLGVCIAYRGFGIAVAAMLAKGYTLPYDLEATVNSAAKFKKKMLELFK